MSERVLKLAERLIVGHKRDGRSVYDEQAESCPDERWLMPEQSLHIRGPSATP
jgi:hypothetical protein